MPIGNDEMSTEHVACSSEIEHKICGVVRPISAIGSYSANHWNEVGEILDSAIESAGFKSRLVSDGNSTGIIHARIVANLYSDTIVVCDISGKNPNVMLELGMRLAFDKAVVVIKDDITDYSFDASPIEHLSYPSTLHYPTVVEFKARLSEKIIGTVSNYNESKSFLQQFGPIKVPKLDEIGVPGYEIVMDQISEIRAMIQALSAPMSGSKFRSGKIIENTLTFRKKLPEDLIGEVYVRASKLSAVDKINISFTEKHMLVRIKPESIAGWDQQEANEAIRELLREYLISIPLPEDNQ